MDVGDLAEDTPGLSPLLLPHSTFSFSPSSETSMALSTQAPFHSAPDHQSTDQHQQAVYQHHSENILCTNPHLLDSEPPCKRPRLEDSRTLLAFPNKPIGIALPQKIETRDEYGSQRGLSKSSDLSSMKQFVDVDIDSKKEKLRTGSTSSSSGSSEDSCVLVNKPYVDSGFAENSCTEVGSSVDGHWGKLSGSEDNCSDIEGDDTGDRRPPTVSDHFSSMAVGSMSMAKSTSSQGSTNADRAVIELPEGKRCHVFISHSTSDRPWAEKAMFIPLSKTWKVRACFQFMPDSSRYNDADIMGYMQYTCVVIIGLSPAYMQSGRCLKEWKFAVNLASERGICVVVASLITCSRPDPLRKFLYLDFHSDEKLEKVWEVLQKEIRDGVKRFQQKTPTIHGFTGISHPHCTHQELSHSQLPHPHLEHYHHDRSHHPHFEQQLQHTSYEGHSSSHSSQENNSCMDSDDRNERSRQIMAEFNQMYEETQEELMGNCLSMEPEENFSSENGAVHEDDIDSAGEILEHYGDDQMTSNFGLSTPGFDMAVAKIIGGEQGEEQRQEEDEEEEEEKEDMAKEDMAKEEEREGSSGNLKQAREEHRLEKSEVDKNRRKEERDGVVQKKPKARRGSSGDVEEGEVSDSSEEVSCRSLKSDEGSEDSGSFDEQEESAKDITKFYDNLAKPDADKRDESPIKLMRNFNNWVKSILLRTYLQKCVPGSTALDLCCGKGGDLLKWKEGRIKHLVCADISGDSIEAAKERYGSPKMKYGNRDSLFTAEFFSADCTKERLIDLAQQRWHFNISSCQFSLHYSFESYEKAHMMLQNACESLRPEAYFVGTTVDADQLVNRLRKKGKDENGQWSIGNKVFSVTLDSSLDIFNLPLFGARYNFKLHDVVDLPEFLIHFPLLVKMLEEFDMELVLKQNFYHFFQEHRNIPDDKSLLFRMTAFNREKGTMSQDEWDVIGLYLVFVFQKRKPSSHHENS